MCLSGIVGVNFNGVVSGVKCGRLASRRNSTPHPRGGLLRQQREAFVLVGGGDSGGPVYQKRGRRSARAVGIVSSGSSPYFSTTVLGEPTVVYLVMRYTHARRFERKSAAGICTPRRC